MVLINARRSRERKFVESLLVTSARSHCTINADHNEVQCASTSLEGLPEISFSLNGKVFTLAPKDYMITNHLGFMSIDVSDSVPLFILGDTFIKTFYTVFDQDNKRIGFARPKDTPLIILRYTALSVGLLLLILAVAVIFKNSCSCSWVGNWRRRRSSYAGGSPRGAYSLLNTNSSPERVITV
jgi:hypothetical protein